MNKSTHYVFPFGNLIATKEMECEEDFGDEEDTETNLFCTKGIMHSDLYHASWIIYYCFWFTKKRCIFIFNRVNEIKLLSINAFLKCKLKQGWYNLAKTAIYKKLQKHNYSKAWLIIYISG